MKARYTYANLHRDCDALNDTLKHVGSKYQLVVGSRNGYSAIDLATPEHCCERNLICGTPRECIAEARTFVLSMSQVSKQREAKLRSMLEKVVKHGDPDGLECGVYQEARELLNATA